MMLHHISHKLSTILDLLILVETIIYQNLRTNIFSRPSNQIFFFIS